MEFRHSERNNQADLLMPKRRERVFRAFCLSLACVFLLLDVCYILPHIWPPGRDFPLLCAASSLAREGQAAAAYDPARLREIKQNIIDPFVWYYPPTFLLMVLPLSLLPYVASQIAWIGVTLSGYLLVLRRIAPCYVTILLGLAFPGAVVNLIFSHNGYLSVVFLGSGLLLLDRAPWSGGALLGLMSYKPQLAVLIPIALVAGRRWKALLGAAVSALVLA